MGWSSHVLTAPVGMGDISLAVGNSSLDLGTLVANGSIKKWALHKPVRLLSSYDTPTDISSYNTWITYMQSRVAKSDGSGSAPFGLLLGSSTNLYDVIGTNSAPAADWVYQQPPASGSYWRRMLDFNGYTDNPNVPINPPGTFTYYKNSGSNIIELDTNDGEAGDSSIPVSVLSQLNDYQLMLVIKNTYSSPNNWYWTVMDGSIMSAAASSETHLISFSLPASLGISNNSSSGYDAYLVGVAKSANLVSGQWNIATEAQVQNFYSMIPLPFAEKADANFKFKVAADPDTNIVHYTYTIYMTQAYVVKYIEFNVWIYRNVAPPTSFVVSFSNIVAHPDYDDSANFPFTNEILTFGNNGQAFTYNLSTRMSSATIKRDVSSFNYTLDSYPNLTFDKSNSSNYGWEDGGFEIKFID